MSMLVIIILNIDGFLTNHLRSMFSMLYKINECIPRDVREIRPCSPWCLHLPSAICRRTYALTSKPWPTYAYLDDACILAPPHRALQLYHSFERHALRPAQPCQDPRLEQCRGPFFWPRAHACLSVERCDPSLFGNSLLAGLALGNAASPVCIVTVEAKQTQPASRGKTNSCSCLQLCLLAVVFACSWVCLPRFLFDMDTTPPDWGRDTLHDDTPIHDPSSPRTRACGRGVKRLASTSARLLPQATKRPIRPSGTTRPEPSPLRTLRSPRSHTTCGPYVAAAWRDPR